MSACCELPSVNAFVLVVLQSFVRIKFSHVECATCSSFIFSAIVPSAFSPLLHNVVLFVVKS